MSISIAVIIGYLLIFIAIGLYLNSSHRSSTDWAIGGGSMGIWLLAAGVAGTRIGGAGTYGVAGDVMVSGLGTLWYSINSFIALLLVGLFFAIPYRRLSLSSIGEVFDRRFGSKRCQWLTSLCVQTEYLIVNIIEPFVIGSIISGVTGLPFVYCVYIGGIVILLFTATGGLKGTAITNIIHCSVVIFGLGVVGFMAMERLGGWGQTMAKAGLALAEADIDQASWWSLTGIGWTSIIALFISATIHTPGASVYVNYSSAAKRQRYLIPGFFLAGCLAALMPLLAGFVGVATLAEYGASSGLAGYKQITQLAADTGPIVGGIALAAILAALISSGAPILLASATMLVNDWVPGSKNLSETKKLRAYKITTLGYGLFATTIAWQANIGSVLQLLLLGFAMVVPVAIGITYVFYWKRVTEQAVFWGMVSGYVGGLLHWLLNTLFSELNYAQVGGFAQFWYELCQALGEWSDPSFTALLLPLAVTPLVVIFSPVETDTARSNGFYGSLGQLQRNFDWR